MSTLFVAILTYQRPLEEIDAQLPAHAQWLDKAYEEGIFIASGRRIPRTGGVILARGESLDALTARMAEDPLQRLGLARVEIIPFEASKGIAALTLAD